MTQPPSATLTETEASEILRSLLQKEGSWVDWGKKCQQLQKAGYSPQMIFEQTGFQAVQQNLIIVSAQVYDSLSQEAVDESILQYYRGPKSDVLYELRILTQAQRAATAITAAEHRLEADGAKELARAVQDFALFAQFPAGFTDHPGDTLAYQCWKLAKQNRDLTARTRLIAKGLKFAHSSTARTAIEQLLSDIAVTPSQKAPLIPLYRQENEEQVARLIPVVGTLPLTVDQVQSIPSLTQEDPFGIVNTTINAEVPSRLVPLPGWQVIIKAQDPVAILAMAGDVAESLSNKTETVLVVVDRALQTWRDDAYFLVAIAEKTAFRWSKVAPQEPILGQVIVVLRPKRIFDENNLLEPWQMDD